MNYSKRLHSIPKVLIKILLVLYISVPVQGKEDNGIRSLVEHALGSYKLEKATLYSEKLPSEAYQKFYELHIITYKYLALQDDQFLTAIQQEWEGTITLLERLPQTDSLKDILLAELHTKRSALEFLESNYWSALRHGQAARKHIRRSQQLFQDLPEQLKIEGLMNVAFGSVPKKFKWLTHALGYKGDIEKGLAQLNKAAEQSSLLPMEALIIASYVEKNILSRPYKTIQHLKEKKRELGEDQILLDLFLASSFDVIKQNESAIEILSKREIYANNQEIFFIPYWDYLLGKAYYHKEKYTKAQIFLAKYLKNHTGNLFHTDAAFRLGMALTLMDQYPQGRRFFLLIKSQQNSGLEEDEYAAHLANAFFNQAPSGRIKVLFRARNLFDGGYHDRALSVLDELVKDSTELNIAELTELYYRYARIHHSIGNHLLASSNYQKCISQPANSELWLQVYSYFFLAELAKDEGDIALARSRYQKALSYDEYFYQAGLENRCKVALAELN